MTTEAETLSDAKGKKMPLRDGTATLADTLP